MARSGGGGRRLRRKGRVERADHPLGGGGGRVATHQPDPHDRRGAAGLTRRPAAAVEQLDPDLALQRGDRRGDGQD